MGIYSMWGILGSPAELLQGCGIEAVLALTVPGELAKLTPRLSALADLLVYSLPVDLRWECFNSGFQLCCSGKASP